MASRKALSLGLTLVLAACGNASVESSVLDGEAPGSGSENSNDGSGGTNDNASSNTNSNAQNSNDNSERDNENSTGSENGPTTLRFIEGLEQSATVDTALPVNPAVRVEDDMGQPIPGVEVSFRVSLGAGTIGAESVVSDGSGIARTSWTLGTVAGENQLEAAVGVLTATLTATGLPGPIENLVAQPNVEGQFALVSNPVPVAPSVRAEDRFANAIAGTAVVFAPSAVESGTVVGGTVMTNSSGVAAVTSWILGASPGVQTLIVSAGAVTLEIDATALLTAPDELERVDGDAQTGSVGSLLPTNLQVRLVDAVDTPLVGVTVSFQVTSGGGSLSAMNVPTDALGIAGVAWTLGTLPGEQSVLSRVGELTVEFGATALPGAPAAVTPSIGVGGQSAIVNQIVPVAPAVLVSDAFGNPVGGVEVTFSVSEGGGSVDGASAITDSSGSAVAGSWRLGQMAGDNELTASVDGSALATTIDATGTPDLPNALRVPINIQDQTAPAGTAVPLDPTVVVEDQFGNPISGVEVVFMASDGTIENVVDTSDADGEATAGRWTLSATGGENEVSAMVSGTAIVATIRAFAGVSDIAVISGNLQVAAPGATLSDPVVVEVRQGDMPVNGQLVRFAPESGSGSVTVTDVLTGSDGRAQAEWTLGSGPGLQGLVVQIVGQTEGRFEVVFDAAASEFDIQVEFRAGTDPTQSERDAFELAAFRWQTLITVDEADFGNVTVPNDGRFPCVTEDTFVDDLVIFVEFEPIDGLSGTLARAGACVLRGVGGSPAVGLMEFDSADLEALEMNGLLDATVLHEMGHVLGLGTAWAQAGVIDNPSTTGTGNDCMEVPGQDTRYNNALGGLVNAEYVALGGSGFVPLENNTALLGCGSLDTHWRESVFGDELMSPVIGSTNPLSGLTIFALSEFGFYNVNFTTEDPYSLPSGSGGLVAPPPSLSPTWCGTRPGVPVAVIDGLIVLDR